MKRLVCLLFGAGALLAAELSGVHAVYLFPMSHGLDQYLANRLTNGHLFLVVTDPKLADSFFSDRVGKALEAQINAALAKPEVKDAAKDASRDTAKDASQDAAKKEESAKIPAPAKSGSQSSLPMFGDTVNKLDNPAVNSSWGRSQGNVFLVDAKSRQVVWSTFQPPKDSTAKELDRTASDIVNRLKKDLNPGQK